MLEISCRGTFIIIMMLTLCDLVAQRIRRLTTDQEIAGSNPAEIDYIFYIVSKENIVIIFCT